MARTPQSMATRISSALAVSEDNSPPPILAACYRRAYPKLERSVAAWLRAAVSAWSFREMSCSPHFFPGALDFGEGPAYVRGGGFSRSSHKPPARRTRGSQGGWRGGHA